MDQDDIELLEKYGWEVDCLDPLEIYHESGMATGYAAELVLEYTREMDEMQNDSVDLTYGG